MSLPGQVFKFEHCIFPLLLPMGLGIFSNKNNNGFWVHIDNRQIYDGFLFFVFSFPTLHRHWLVNGSSVRLYILKENTRREMLLQESNYSNRKVMSIVSQRDTISLNIMWWGMYSWCTCYPRGHESAGLSLRSHSHYCNHVCNIV